MQFIWLVVAVLAVWEVFQLYCVKMFIALQLFKKNNYVYGKELLFFFARFRCQYCIKILTTSSVSNAYKILTISSDVSFHISVSEVRFYKTVRTNFLWFWYSFFVMEKLKFQSLNHYVVPFSYFVYETQQCVLTEYNWIRLLVELMLTETRLYNLADYIKLTLIEFMLV